MYFSENFDDLFVNNNAPIEGYQNVFDDEATGSDYLNWALDLIGNNNQSIYLSGTEGFYDGKLTNAKEEIDLFVDEINKGVEVEGEEKMFIGGTEGFYDDAKNWTSLGLTTFEAENENNNIFQDNPISEINSENYLETPNNQYLV